MPRSNKQNQSSSSSIRGGDDGNNDSDSDDGGFLTRFHHLPSSGVVRNNNAAASSSSGGYLIRVNNEEGNRGVSNYNNQNYYNHTHHHHHRENTFSSSYILTSSRTAIFVSMIFALLECLLCGLGVVALYEDFESDNIRIFAVVIFFTLISGELVRIYLLSRWWGVSPRSDIEPTRAYGETMKCFKYSTALVLLLISPMCVVIFFGVYALAGLHGSDIPGSLGLFVLVAGFDLLLFIPCFACPTVICAACFWRRVLKRHERGMEYLRRNNVGVVVVETS